MKTNEINIRDPYVLLHEDRYYLYGTRSESCWGEAEGFDCYVSADRENWEGPVEIFHRPEGFWADRAYWAPECVYYRDAFFLITTLGAADRKKGIYVLRSDSPLGPFAPYGVCLTPEDWSCIDGTLYLEEGKPWLIFSHSFEDDPKGDMCLLPLKEDLSGAAGEPVTIFKASQAPWISPVSYWIGEDGTKTPAYVSDGNFVYKTKDGELLILWSSFKDGKYCVAISRSASGKIAGPWTCDPEPIFAEDGGHPMVFKDFDGNLKLVFHQPNSGHSHPVILDLEDTGRTVEIN